LRQLKTVILVNNNRWVRCPFTDEAICHLGFYNFENLVQSKGPTKYPMVQPCTLSFASGGGLIASAYTYKDNASLLVGAVSDTGGMQVLSSVPAPTQVDKPAEDKVYGHSCEIVELEDGSALAVTFGKSLSLHKVDLAAKKTTRLNLMRGTNPYTSPSLEFDTAAGLGGTSLLVFGRGGAVRVDASTGQVAVLGEDLGSGSLLPRSQSRATKLLTGDVLISGGAATSPISGLLEVFHSETNRFEVVGTMSTPRVDHLAIRLLDGRVHSHAKIFYRGSPLPMV
jgi:hypothetical protein